MTMTSASETRMTIDYFTKFVYGKPLMYLLYSDSDECRAILSLIGQKTINGSQMKAFRTLGIDFKEVVNPVSVVIN